MKCTYLTKQSAHAAVNFYGLKNASGSSDGEFFSVDGSASSCVTDNALKIHDDHIVVLPESLLVQDGRG